MNINKNDEGKRAENNVLSAVPNGGDFGRDRCCDDKVMRRNTNNGRNTSLSLPPDVVPNILSFYSDSVSELAVSSQVCISWRNALSSIDHICIEIEQRHALQRKESEICDITLS